MWCAYTNETLFNHRKERNSDICIKVDGEMMLHEITQNEKYKNVKYLRFLWMYTYTH